MRLPRLLRIAILGTLGTFATESWLARRAAAGRPLNTTIHAEVAVLAGRQATWDVLADVPGQVRWMRDAKAIRILTPGPIDVGTRAEADVRIFGLTSADLVEVSAWDEPERFAIRHLGLFKGEGEFRLTEAGDERTIVTWDERLVPPLLPHLGAALLWPALRYVFQADLDRFAALVLEETTSPEIAG